MRSERLMEIESYIYEKKTATLDELCDVFKVSKNTIRRDIEQLLETANIKKTYGGVIVDSATKKELVSFEERNISNSSSKQKIALKAASFIEDGDIIFIDSGTTTSHILQFIKDKHITVLTNNLEVIFGAIPYDNIEIITLSGTLRRKTLSFTGVSAAKILEPYNINKAFLAATGVSINGLTNSSPDETRIKETAVQRSTKRYLLVDHSKFNVVSLLTYCRLNDLDAIISDELPPDDIAEALAEHKVELILS